MRLALGGVALIVAALSSGSAWAQDQQAVKDKVLQFNRDALADVDNLEWDRAKKTLLDALVTAKRGGIESSPIMARTYVHLGVVYVTGFKNRAKAIQSFSRALEIQPDIRMSVGLATAEVNDAFAEAASRPLPVRVQRALTPVPDGAEPDLPARVHALDCYVTEVTRVDEAVPVRCALSPSLLPAKVYLFYREPAKGRFTEVEMRRTPKGWFESRIPERVIYGQSVQYYVEGRDAAGKRIAENGDAHDRNFVLVVPR
jgi:hypothetical protein